VTLAGEQHTSNGKFLLHTHNPITQGMQRQTLIYE
jgi:hypothetical protein